MRATKGHLEPKRKEKGRGKKRGGWTESPPPSHLFFPRRRNDDDDSARLLRSLARVQGRWFFVACERAARAKKPAKSKEEKGRRRNSLHFLANNIHLLCHFRKMYFASVARSFQIDPDLFWNF